MAKIRAIEILNFRGIRQLSWNPSPGINCLIGPGDSGKSTILNAIDLCLGARRNIQFTDADFYRLDVETPITISVTLGELDEELKRFETYGLYLQGFDAATGAIEDEPEKDLETVLTVRLTVESDLEPSWSLVSERAEALGQSRSLSWGDRLRLAPTRIGGGADYHLGWKQGSVLNRVSEERADASAALAQAARNARDVFTEAMGGQLDETLGIVAATAKELGIPMGENLGATLDAHAVSFSDGAISVHDEDGVPLRNLGAGSMRLLVTGLQRRAASQSILLIDELEHGLEPHRIIRLIDSLGAKDAPPPLQVFMTTHSPVALRELAGHHLWVTRPGEDEHQVLCVGIADDIQGTIRKYPEAFLAHSVIVCEGASEVGFLRGIDQFQVASGNIAMAAHGTVPVDSGGGDANRPFTRGAAFLTLGYRTAVFRDDDKKPAEAVQADFLARGGHDFTWREGRALEDELFMSLSQDGVQNLLHRAIDLHGEDLINAHIQATTKDSKKLDEIQTELLIGASLEENRGILGKASRSKKNSWFKTVTWMEGVARDIVGPDLVNADPEFMARVEAIFTWARADE